VGAVLTALALVRPERVLELTKSPGWPRSKFVNWKCRRSFTLLPFLVHVSRQLDSAVTSALDFAWFCARCFSCSNCKCNQTWGSADRGWRLRPPLSRAESARVRVLLPSLRNRQRCVCILGRREMAACAARQSKNSDFLYFFFPTRTLIMIKPALEMLCKN